MAITIPIDAQTIAPLATNYVGTAGTLFFDPTTSTLRVSDGVTVGGQVVGAGGFSYTTASTIAVGLGAGTTNQGTDAIAFGKNSGQVNQGIDTIAVGVYSGYSAQGQYATAIGYSAGQNNQGQYALALGFSAGTNNQAANSIVINATNSALAGTTASAFYVKPVRDGGSAASMSGNGFKPCYYNPTTGEVVYASS
jgi:hypothetical protein